MSVKRGMTGEQKLLLVYLTIYLIAALTLAFCQPLHGTDSLCNPPDEHSRYRVPLYICNHGTLPTGFEEELFSEDVKWTYGFYTLLPYILQGLAMRCVNLFTDSPLALLYAARMVNVICGLMMAYLVTRIGERLFRDRCMKWLFCFLVTFLPQSLFLHTYVNPDSLCLFSTALMIYGLLRGYGDQFSLKSCGLLAAGVILCTLSYYNAYGFILSSILLFTAYFFKKEDGKWHFSVGMFLRRGLLIAGVVILCTAWSFVRNYLLYDGDVIGLATKEAFVKSFGTVRETYQSRGESLFAMLTGTPFFPKLLVSFIACYGSAKIYTWIVIYIGYGLLFAAGLFGAVFCKKQETTLPVRQRGQRIFFHINLIFCIAMPLILTIRYAYTVDYQAQGRYIMPGLIPIMYYVCLGLQSLPFLRKCSEKRKNILVAAAMALTVAAVLVTVFLVALPIYLKESVL